MVGPCGGGPWGGGFEVGREDIYMDMIQEISIRKILIRVAPPPTTTQRENEKNSQGQLFGLNFECVCM